MFKIHFEAFLELFIKNIFLSNPKFSAKNQADPLENCEELSNPPMKTAKNLATPLENLLPPVGIIVRSLIFIYTLYNNDV